MISYLEQFAGQRATQDAFVVAPIIAVVAWISVFFIGKRRMPVDMASHGKNTWPSWDKQGQTPAKQSGVVPRAQWRRRLLCSPSR